MDYHESNLSIYEKFILLQERLTAAGTGQFEASFRWPPTIQTDVVDGKIIPQKHFVKHQINPIFNPPETVQCNNIYLYN